MDAALLVLTDTDLSSIGSVLELVGSRMISPRMSVGSMVHAICVTGDSSA
ncbi:hypothetical protein JS756_31345 [Streptomyces actuosus]|uniref:Uncharacterized protein n=1 Tax=Streptomyces actuosus TaxID=1885 RepID=A0ABS2VZV6_STRAS|nr:hypothetical protein [Streptomyces actuosus]MBN0048515.1 hypothetical protein [Streptomyces actuosus]